MEARAVREPCLAPPPPPPRGLAGALLPRPAVVMAALRMLLVALPMLAYKTLLPLRVLELVDGDTAVADAWLSKILSTASACTLVTTCWLCAASDDAGRRRGLLIVCGGAVADGVGCALAPSCRALTWLHAGAQALGSAWALLALSFANVADVLRDSTARERAVDFAFVESSMYAAVLVAPALSGIAAQRLGTARAFLIAAGFAGLSLLAVAAMDEAAFRPAPARAGREPWSLAWLFWRSPLGALAHFAETRERLVVGAACFSHWLAMRGYEFLLPLVCKGLFHMDSAQQGAIGSFLGAGAIASSVVLVRVIKGDDVALFKQFAAVGAVGLGLVAASGVVNARRVVAFVAGSAFYAAEAPANPALRGMVVGLRGDDGLGFALGAAAVLETLSLFAASLAFAPIYKALPGTTAFLAAAAVMVSSVLLVVCFAPAPSKNRPAAATPDYAPLNGDAGEAAPPHALA